MRPSKEIVLYFLGRVDPIADFYNNEEEAVSTLQHFNKKVLANPQPLPPEGHDEQLVKSEPAAPLTPKQVLLNSRFYYLAGKHKKELVYYVSVDEADEINDDPAFLHLILEKDPDRKPVKEKRNPPGGRKNSENKFSDFE